MCIILAMDNLFENFFIVLGGDDRRVLLWNLEKGVTCEAEPVCMNGEHNSNIFCLAFDNSNSKLFSAGECSILQKVTLIKLLYHNDTELHVFIKREICTEAILHKYIACCTASSLLAIV